jgi:hypothetical protein
MSSSSSKPLLVWLFFCFVIFQPAGEAGCRDMLAGIIQKKSHLRSTPEYSYMEKVTRIEKTTNLLRKIKENPEPALNLKIWKKIAVLDSFLFNGSHAPNERQWRTFFREFEASWISFSRSKRIVDYFNEEIIVDEAKFFQKLQEWGYSQEYQDFIKRSLDELGTIEKLKIQLELEQKSTLTHLGNNYHEYRMVRGHLEELLEKEECNENCRRYANYLLGSLGSESEKEKMMFEIFFKGADRPDIKEMREILYQHETFVLTRLKRERNAEIMGFLTSIVSQPEFIDTVLGYVYKSKLLEKRRAVKLFRMVYDAQARKNHFPKINRVIYGPNEPKRALDLLQSLNTSTGDDELLVTFARRVDGGADKKWAKILEHAKSEDPDFHKRMIEATEKAKARGDMSPTTQRSFVGKLAALVVIGVPTVGYFYFDGLPTSVEEYLYGASESGEASDPNYPKPESDIEIELDGEEDETLQEVGEVLASETDREPSSTSFRPKKGKAIFTQFWCSLLDCR